MFICYFKKLYDNQELKQQDHPHLPLPPPNSKHSQLILIQQSLVLIQLHSGDSPHLAPGSSFFFVAVML